MNATETITLDSSISLAHRERKQIILVEMKAFNFVIRIGKFGE